VFLKKFNIFLDQDIQELFKRNDFTFEIQSQNLAHIQVCHGRERLVIRRFLTVLGLLNRSLESGSR